MVEIARTKTELTINGHTYEIYCASEDLENIKKQGARLAQIVQTHVSETGQIGEVPILLLTCLGLLDRLKQKQRFDKLYSSGTRHFDVAHNLNWNFGMILDKIAARLEIIAAEVERQNQEETTTNETL